MAFFGDFRRMRSPRRKIKRGLKRESDETFLSRVEEQFKAGNLTGPEIFKQIAARGGPSAPGMPGAPFVPPRAPSPRPNPVQPGGARPATPPPGALGGGRLGPFGRAVKRRQGGKPGDASVRPRELRDRAARLRARATAEKQQRLAL